jgi:hypothetical protein
MAKRRQSTKRHRLLIYYRLGQRMRTAPFLIAIFTLALVGIGWLGNQGILTGGNRDLITRLWEGRLLLYVAVGASLLLYLLSLYISRGSYVEARPKALRVRAGLVTVDISYARIQQMRLVQFGLQYPLDSLRGSEAALVEPFEGSTCSAVDLRSLPRPFTPRLLRRIWSKFMFTADRRSLMFVVADPMVLNQQIDGYIANRQARIKQKTQYIDPIERAAKEAAERAQRAKKTPPPVQANVGRKR